MISVRWSLRSLFLLTSVMFSGILLAYLMHIRSELAPVGNAVGMLFPFVIAGLTGAAQTTTV